MEQSTKQFVEGIRTYRTKEGVPEWIKLNLVIDKPALIMWLESQEEAEIRIDLKESKGGKLYMEKNTWKATATPEKPQKTAQQEFEALGDKDTKGTYPEPTKDNSVDSIPF